MRIDIIGAGSLGLLLAGRLITAGNEVRVWCRSHEQPEVLKRDGITISYEDGREPLSVNGSRFVAGNVAAFADHYMREPSDWIVITVKQNVLHRDLPEVLGQLSSRRPSIVCFQNGTGHMEMLEQLLPGSDLFTAVTTEGAKRITLTEVIHAGKGEVWIGTTTSHEAAGAYSAGASYENKANPLVETLLVAGFSAFLSNEMNTMIYRKLLINAVINPLTAIWRIPNGQLLSSETRVQVMRELYDEAIQVYEAYGIPYEADAWNAIVGVCRATSGNTSSMLADVLAGRATEIRWINGSLIKMAERLGLEVPLQRCMCRLVEGMIAEER